MMVIPNRVRVLAVMVALALVGGLLSLVLLSKHTQAKPPTANENHGAVSQEFPLGFTLDAVCMDEPIDITGTVHTVEQSFPDGGYHVHFNLQNVKGVGQTTGKEYIIRSKDTDVEHVLPNGGTISGSVDINLVIGKGSLPNEVGLVQFHYILTNEGVVKVDVGQSHLKCPPSSAPPTTASPTATASATASTQ